MNTSTILCIVAFFSSAAWALFIRALCEVWHWHWVVALISFIVIFLFTMLALCIVNASGGAVKR